MTLEAIVGWTERKRLIYSPLEIAALKKELYSYACVRNENFSKEVIEAWIDEFQLLNMPVTEVAKRVRLAKLEKKYGVTDFSIFMEVNPYEYANSYKHLTRESNEEVSKLPSQDLSESE